MIAVPKVLKVIECSTVLKIDYFVKQQILDNIGLLSAVYA